LGSLSVPEPAGFVPRDGDAVGVRERAGLSPWVAGSSSFDVSVVGTHDIESRQLTVCLITVVWRSDPAVEVEQGAAWA